MNFPTNKYRCIVVDPPWPMRKIERYVRPNQTVELDYSTISLKEIEAIPIYQLASEQGCHIYLWTTQKYFPSALNLFEEWGIKYQCVLTWVKPTGMTPYSWMYNTELVLFGRIGNLKLLKYGVKLSFNAPSLGHSRKPDVFYDIVRKVSPEPRLNMFAREERFGFDGWGNEYSESVKTGFLDNYAY